ncbi:MAG: SRPBCC family protein [Acidimicrobiia bacterium]
MTEPVVHDTFVIEREYPAPPERVFAAWADPAIKVRWFVGPDEFVQNPLSLDFRVGGREHIDGGDPGGPVHSYDAEYREIVDNVRFVTTYTMRMDDTLASVSVATLEFEAIDGGTRMTMTEQGAYLIDGDTGPKSRLDGTNGLLDQLGVELARSAAGR